VRDSVTQVEIRTPEGVVFSLALAGPLSRALAWLADAVLILVVGVLVSSLLALAGAISPDLAQAVMVLAWFGLQVGYGVGFEWGWRGQTPGKRMLGLRVVDEQALRLAFSQVLMRNLLRFVDFLPGLYGLGGLTMLLNRRSQRLGDRAAGTLVIRNTPRTRPSWDPVEAGKYNSLWEQPHRVARLRQRADPEAAFLAVRALLRREGLDPGARLVLFREVADYYRGLVDLPEAWREGMTDEQLVRNVVEVLFRRAKE
jgi:uncharacterized RDD family membrane protein YckC